MEKNEDIQLYIKNLQENEINQFYNLPNQKLKRHIIQFKQLIAYFNFKLRLKTKLKNQNNFGEFMTEIFLIDKRWLSNWKKHVGYYEIKKKFTKDNNNIRELNENDYDIIEPIINSHSVNLLTPLENKKIYNNKNELDLYAEFVIVDKSCFYLFTLVNKIPKNLLSLIKSYQIRIYQEKYILIIDDKRCILKFRENEKNQKFELLFILKHEKINQEAFCQNIGEKGINNYIKKYQINLFETELRDTEYFTAINKTLYCIKMNGINFGKKKENNPLLFINGEINKDLQKTIIQDHNNLKQTYLNNTRKIRNNKAYDDGDKFKDYSETKKLIKEENFLDKKNNNNLNPKATTTVNYNNTEFQYNNLSHESQINELRIQLNEERNKNMQLDGQLKILMQQINFFNTQLNEEKNKNQLLNNKLNQMTFQINMLQKQLNEERTKNQYNGYQMQMMNQNNYNLDITSINPGEKIMAINFVSMGNQSIINYSLPCKNTDLFVRLEEKLYNDFPKFKDYETYFEVRTKRIKRFKTLDENDIRSNDVISVFIIEN